MSMSLEKAIQSSEKGYISSDEEIEDIMSHFTQITAKELKEHNIYCQNYLNAFADELRHHKLPADILDNCTLLELLWLTDNTVTDVYGASYEYQTYCLASMRYFLRSLAKSHSWITLFLSINLNAFLRYHDIMRQVGYRVSSRNKIHTLARKHLRLEIAETTTIGDLLSYVEKGMSAYWSPWQNKQVYINDIKGCYEILSVLLVDCVKEYSGYSIEAMKAKAQAFVPCEKTSNDIDYPY